MSGTDGGPVRFDSLELHNYRVYRQADFRFPASGSHDLHIVVGHGGCGKTNLMNAMSWCLYNQERYVPSQSEGLPIVHQLEGKGSADPSLPVVIKLTTSRQDPNSTTRLTDTFVRTQANGASSFKHQQIRDRELVLTEEGDKASRHVNTLIPREMKSYYFFDGEKIQDFLFNQAASNVEPALSYLSRIRLLQTTVDHLTGLQTDLQRQIGRNNPDMLKLVDQKDHDSEELRNLKSELERQEKERDAAREERDRYDKLLHTQGGATDLPDRQTRLESQRDDLNARVRAAEAAYRLALYRFAGHVFAETAMTTFETLVADKEGKNELPPPVEPSLLQRLLDSGKCICGRSLNDEPGARESLEAMMQRVRDISHLGAVVEPIRQHVSFVEQQLQREPDDVRALRQTWTDLRRDRNKVVDDLADVDSELQRIDIGQVRLSQKNRQEQQDLYDTYGTDIAKTKLEIQDIEKRLAEEEKQIDLAQAKQLTAESQKAKLKVVNSAIAIARDVLSERNSMVRTYVSERFDEVFHQMMWQKDLYSQAFLDDSYRVHVLHAGGGEALATMSESEKEAAALAFILALHEVSGYQGPLVVDFPFGRTTGKMTDQIAEIIKSLSMDRQVILLMTDTEFEATRSILQPCTASVCTLARQDGETIVEATA